MANLREGTRIMLRYQIPMYDTGMLEYVDADAGREFIVVKCSTVYKPRADHPLCVVEPDEYEPGADYTQDHMVIEDIDAVAVMK